MASIDQVYQGIIDINSSLGIVNSSVVDVRTAVAADSSQVKASGLAVVGSCDATTTEVKQLQTVVSNSIAATWSSAAPLLSETLQQVRLIRCNLDHVNQQTCETANQAFRQTALQRGVFVLALSAVVAMALNQLGGAVPGVLVAILLGVGAFLAVIVGLDGLRNRDRYQYKPCTAG